MVLQIEARREAAGEVAARHRGVRIGFSGFSGSHTSAHDDDTTRCSIPWLAVLRRPRDNIAGDEFVRSSLLVGGPQQDVQVQRSANSVGAWSGTGQGSCQVGPRLRQDTRDHKLQRPA